MGVGLGMMIPGIYVFFLGMLIGFTSNAAPETVNKFCSGEL